MNGAEVLLRTLTASGIDVCFMNPGTSEMQFVSALDRVSGMRGVLCLFEGVCSGAADGYARMTGRPAATLLHLGPGLANALSNFHNARKALSPVVGIVGEHSTQHLQYDAPLSADIAQFARSVSNDVRTLRAASEMGATTAAVIEAARRPPGQVAHLIVPADFSWSEAGEPAQARPIPRRNAPAAHQIEGAHALLQHGSHTAILLGGTAATGDGPTLAGRLAHTFGVKVFTHRNAARIDSGRGTFRPRKIAYFPEQATAMLAGIRHMILVESAPPVSFFGYPDQPSYLAPDDAAIQILATAEQDGIAALRELVGYSRAGKFHVEDEPEVPEPSPGDLLNAETIGRTLRPLIPDQAMISDEMVSSAEPVWNQLLGAAPYCFMPVAGGSIGQGLPLALGAAMACPNRRSIALEADGSALYTPQALWTMARENLDVTVVIFANRRYGILDIEMRRTGAQGFGSLANDMIDISRPDLDFVRLAESMGVPATRTRTAGELKGQFADALRERGPRLIEAIMV